MPFLALNGITIPIANDSANLEPDLFQERGRSPNARLWLQRTAIKRGYTLATPPRPSLEVSAIQGLVLGEGHVWPASAALGLYSSKGQLMTVSGGTLVRNASVGKFGSDSLQLADGATASSNLKFPNGPASTSRFATLSFWYSSNAGVTWVHHVYLSRSGVWYDNGVVGSGPAIGVTYSGGLGWSFSNATGGTVYLDDVWIVPYEMPGTWPAMIHTYNAAVGLCPFMKASGDLIESGLTIDVVGDEPRAALAQGRGASSFETNLHALEFRLAEV